MAKYVCSFCGYVYDETQGDPKNGVPAGTLFGDLPDGWLCPRCGAEQSAFRKEEAETVKAEPETHDADLREMSAGELSVIFSNLAKGCEKQYRAEEAELFMRLSSYYSRKTDDLPAASLRDLTEKIKADMPRYAPASQTASDAKDRGALRSLVWSEKVTRILGGMIPRYERNGESLLEKNNIYVCDICGFVYIGQAPPDICPVCKVPSLKINAVQKGAM